MGSDIPDDTRIGTAAIAAALVDARRNRVALTAFPGEPPQDLTSAYAVQDSALGIWNKRIGGWKVGRINAPDDARLGANRLAGPIFADSIVDAESAEPPMPVFTGGFAAGEAEFMLRLAPPAGATAMPADDAETLAWIDAVRIGIEIASSPYAAINDDGPCVTISDQGNNAGLVLGLPVARELWPRIAEIEVETLVDGQSVGTATTATILDGPLGAVRFLLGNLASRGIVPEAGWWISSGAVTGVHPVAVGQQVAARFAGIGEVRCRIT
ncbi:MAG: 2-keto-4-pentenoate hydratase [Alteraurantiacibacter sp.]